MNTHILSATLKDTAKARLTGHYGLLIGSQLIISCIAIAAALFASVFVSFPITLTNVNPFVSTTFLYAATLLTGTFVGVFQVGSTLIYLKFACGNPNASLSDLFYGFENDFKTALGISFVTAVIAMLPTLSSDIFNNIYTLTNNEIYLIISSFSELIVRIPCYFISLLLFPCYYLMLDFPGKSTGEIFRLCFRILKGNKRKLIYIALSFIPLQILSVLSIIGGFWVEPYVLMTQTLFFLEIMKKENVE